MNTNPQTFRRRPAEIEAVQWTGSNADELRAFAGSDFDTIDPEDRIEDPDQDAQLLVEASHWVGIRPGEWVLKFEGYFVAKRDETFRAVWEPAAEAPLSPDYEHPECGFHWHGRDGMDIPMRDGQPVCPRCELRRVEKLLNHRERRCEELRVESKRRGKNVLERGEKIRAMEREIDGIRRQLGAEILRANEAEASASAVVSPPPATHATDRAVVERVRVVLETEAVVGRSALEYRGLITSALMADEEQPAVARQTLVDLIRDWLDPDPCRLDHHGYCQAHNWLCGGKPCPHARAREVLATIDAEAPR